MMRLEVRNSEVPEACRSCHARSTGVCAVLNDEQLFRLSRRACRRKVAAGTGLVAAGERVQSYSNIKSGVVKLIRLMRDGRQQIVGLQFAPDFIGQPLSDSRTIGVEAASNVQICTFPRTTLEELMRQNPELERRLHLQTMRELDEAREWLMTLGRKSAEEKVASFILLLSRHGDPAINKPSESFDIPLKRADIADFLGLTIETVSRHLTRLRNSEIISIEKSRHVTVRDRKALLETAGQ